MPKQILFYCVALNHDFTRGADAREIFKFIRNRTLKEKIQLSYLFQVERSLIKLVQVQSLEIIYGTNYINKYMAKFLIVLQPHLH